MPDEENTLVPSPRGELVVASGVEALLAQVRPAWQAKTLIERVRRLLNVDPSSACQRLFNAAIQDLREKIIVAGLDIAREAASAHKLPSVAKNEDVLDSYSTSNILDLAYRMGLLTRPEWRRLRRVYDIRRDLEHEDDEYQASVEDCVYVFKSCVEIVLAQDPIQLLRVADVRELIENPGPVTPSLEFLRDYERAPDPRQREIGGFLVNAALDGDRPDRVRQNAVEALRNLQPLTHNTVKIELSAFLQQRTRRRDLTDGEAKVAAAGGFLAYMPEAQREQLFRVAYNNLNTIGYGWRNWQQHGEALDELEDKGGLSVIPAATRRDIVLWMVLCFIGEPGGYGWYGRNRPVFYSDSAAPRIERMFQAAGQVILEDVGAAANDPRVNAALKHQPIARRYEKLLDLVTVGENSAGAAE